MSFRKGALKREEKKEEKEKKTRKNGEVFFVWSLTHSRLNIDEYDF